MEGIFQIINRDHDICNTPNYIKEYYKSIKEIKSTLSVISIHDYLNYKNDRNETVKEMVQRLRYHYYNEADKNERYGYNEEERNPHALDIYEFYEKILYLFETIETI